MTTITEFLLARIAEDEAVAVASAAIDPVPWRAAEGFVLVAEHGDCEVAHEGRHDSLYGGLWDDEGAGSLDMAEETAAHVARHDPARVLAECKAKRAIVEGCQLQANPVVRTAPASYSQIRILAAVYADHPDFDPEWSQQ
jgi:hypothetical protein